MPHARLIPQSSVSRAQKAVFRWFDVVGLTMIVLRSSLLALKESASIIRSSRVGGL